MRGHFLNYPAVARLLLTIAVALAIGLTTVWLVRRRELGTLHPAPATLSSRALHAELARCQSIGTAAQRDRACIATWAENRRRFFGNTP